MVTYDWPTARRWFGLNDPHGQTRSLRRETVSKLVLEKLNSVDVSVAKSMQVFGHTFYVDKLEAFGQ